MPKILVADDNSNIQKMVANALKEQGIDVVGVGNGEAAIRKMPEMQPDMVLADVFMPVRDGYELCEWIKNNEKYVHVPVFLLVGAFDPLDEHRVQSVRADGVLKKPFVPPDPLITVVKAMLERAAKNKAAAALQETHHEFAASVPHAEETQKLAPEEIRELTGEKAPASAAAAATAPDAEEEMMGFGARAKRVEFGEEEKPLAFGDLMETEAHEEEEEEEEKPTFRASSVMDLEERASSAAAPPAAEEPAQAETHAYAGIQEEARQPSPDEPPIKVEFGPSEPMELVTDESHAAPSIPATEIAPELVTSSAEIIPEYAPSAVEAMPVEAAAAAPAYEIPTISTPPEPERIPEISVAPTGVPSAQLPGLSWSERAAVEASRAPEPSATVRTMPVAHAVDPALVDAVVERVLARLRPDILDQITREIVRPLAEALLRREGDK